MARIEDGEATVYAGVDTTFKALRTALRPPETTGWQSIAASTGVVAGLTANTTVFSFRNLGPDPILIRRVVFSNICTTFSLVTIGDFGLTVARSFTASDSAGTAVLIRDNNMKLRSSTATPVAVDCRISSTASLTVGTRTLDANSISQCSGVATAVGVMTPLTDLFRYDGGYPLIIQQNEGVVIQNLTSWAGGIFAKFYVMMEFALVADSAI